MQPKTSSTEDVEDHGETELVPLPEDWQIKRLQDLVSYRKGKKPKVLVQENNNRSLPYLTASYFRTGQATQFVPNQYIGKNIICEEQDTVLIWDGSNSGDVFTGLRGVLASTMVKVVPKLSELEPAFLHFFLQTQFGLLNSQTTGSTIPHVSKNLFSNLRTPLPPLPEQKSIAQVLRTVQKAIETTEQVIESTRELKRSLMNHLFTYGPVPVDEAEQVPLKETEIGPVPDHWEITDLGSVAESRFKNGIFVKGPRWGSGVRYLNVADVYANSTVQIQDLRLMDIELANQQGFQVKAGDAVFVRSSLKREGIAKACMVPPSQENIVFDCHLIKVSPDKTIIHPLYLVEYCRSKRGHTRLIALSKTTTMTTIPQANLAQFQLPLPPLFEQEKIAAILKETDRKIEVEENRKQTLQVLFKTLLHNLMTGKIRVKDLDLSQTMEVV